MNKYLPEIQIQPIEEMKKLISTLIMFLALMKHGSAATQLTVMVLLTSLMGTLSVIIEVFNTYVFPDPNFKIVFAVLIIWDTIFGIIRHFKEKTFSPKQMFKGFGIKLVAGFAVMMCVKAIVGMPEMLILPYIADTLTLFTKSAIIGWVGFSLMGNVYILTGGKFPPALFMERFEKFSKSANPNDLLYSNKNSKLK